MPFHLTVAYLWLYNHRCEGDEYFSGNENAGKSLERRCCHCGVKSLERSPLEGLSSGPHLHLGDRELPYLYRDEHGPLQDFWELSRKAGFEP